MKLTVVFEYLDKATAPMAKTEKQFGSFGKTVSQASACMFKLNQSAEFMQRMGDNMGRLMQPGVQFEQSMADLSSITGIAGKNLDRLGKIARKTGVVSGLGASGAADAFALLASQIDVSKIGMDGLVGLQSKTITLAQASGMSMADAANSLSGTINQFGLQADQAGRVINVLAAGSKYGAAEIPQLAESFKVVGAAANAAGLTVEQTAGAIEVLSKNNLKGAEAGTALRNIVLKMQTAMGVDFSKTSLQEALIKLKPHMKDATYMSKLFGMENVAAAQFMVANTDLLGEMTDRVTDTNVAQEQAAIRTNTWSHKIKVQTAQFNDWMIGLQKNCGGVMYAFQLLGQGSSMLLTFAPIGKMFVGIGQGVWGAGLGIIKFGRTLKMLSLAQNTRSAFGYARAIASCGLMGRVAAIGINWWSKATKIAGLIQGGFMKMLRGLRMVMITGVLPSLIGIISATWAWTAALLANPIVLIVMAIIALITAIVLCWKKFAAFRAAIYTIWDTIKGFGKALFNFLVAPLKAVWRIVSGLGKALWKLFTGDFKGAAEEFKGAFKSGLSEGAEEFKKGVDGVKKTATGISGNYEMHLTEERAKQEEEEKRKKENPVANLQMPGLDFPDAEISTESAVPEVNGQPETVPGTQIFQVSENVRNDKIPDTFTVKTAADPQQRTPETKITPVPTISQPSIKNVAPAADLNVVPMLENQISNVSNNVNNSTADNRQTTTNNNSSQAAKIEMKFQPTINISAELTQKTKDDFLKTLKQFGDEIAKMVEEVNRKNGRGAYAVS